MKKQTELRAEFHRLFEADLLEEAEAILDQLEPPTEEEWRKMHDEAPVDDEPLSEHERARLNAAGIHGDGERNRAAPRAG